jgi:6-phosphogluconolactonase
MHTHPALRVVPTGADASRATAALIVEGLTAAIAERGVAHWVTTGGSACPGIYEALFQPPLSDALDWSRVHVWWGDDRFVPADDAASNVRPFAEMLLAPEDGLPFLPEHVHRVDVAGALAHGAGPAWAAEAYDAALRSVGPAAGPDGVPVFDVFVVGVGSDGHILSVFPGSGVWDDEALVADVAPPTHMRPHLARVTMHPRLLPAARAVVVVTAGGTKADALSRAWADHDGHVRALPVEATMLPQSTWILDEAAAAKLRHG